MVFEWYGYAFRGGSGSILESPNDPSSYPVTIKSQSRGADFYIENEDGEKVGSRITPKLVTLKSGAGYFDGETYTINFSKTVIKESL